MRVAERLADGRFFDIWSKPQKRFMANFRGAQLSQIGHEPTKKAPAQTGASAFILFRRGFGEQEGGKV